MESLFERVTPRDDVLSGDLTEAKFAASLEEVAAGTAPDTYQDAGTFFAGTFPSGGLRTLLNEALGRLGGGKPDGASVIRLETNLGGGKTHNLIALYHAAACRLPADLAGEFMDPGLLPSEPVDRIGVFVGTASGATSFPAVAGITPRTVWGYLALQVSGAEGYQLVQADDEALTAPGSDALKRLLAGRPVLLLLDEIARYYLVAGGREGRRHDAGRADNSVPDGADGGRRRAGARGPGHHDHRVDRRVRRRDGSSAGRDQSGAVADGAQGAGARPSEEADLPKILTRRLFKPVQPGAAAVVGAAYADTADAAFSAGLDLPEGMTGAGWATEVSRTYPFHPALIRVLDKRLSTIPNFQRTRGALRLLARAVRDLWDERPENVQLIHLHHLDLSDRVIAEELSSRLERSQYEPVIRADIASQAGGEKSHAERVDEHMGSNLARRLATTIYLYSLTRDVPGVPAAELYGAVLSPGRRRKLAAEGARRAGEQLLVPARRRPRLPVLHRGQPGQADPGSRMERSVSPRRARERPRSFPSSSRTVS